MNLRLLLKESRYKSIGRLPDWLAPREKYSTQIRALRTGMGMTQAQLATRGGLDPRMIRRLESGTGDPQISTLTKVVSGLECEMVLRFVPKRPLAATLRDRAFKKAHQIVAQVKGTAAIEEQQPDEKYIRHLVEETARDLIDRKPSLLWDEDV